MKHVNQDVYYVGKLFPCSSEDMSGKSEQGVKGNLSVDSPGRIFWCLEKHTGKLFVSSST